MAEILIHYYEQQYKSIQWKRLSSPFKDPTFCWQHEAQYLLGDLLTNLV